MAVALSSIDIKLAKRGKWYPQIWVRGTEFPPVPDPLTVMRATHTGSGTAVDFTSFLVYGPTRLYVWGTVPRHSPKGRYNLAYVVNDVAISTITNAFRVK